MQTDFGASLIAFAAVKDHIAQHGPRKGEHGTVEIACPVCNAGTLVVSVHTNGHTWGSAGTFSVRLRGLRASWRICPAQQDRRDHM